MDELRKLLAIPFCQQCSDTCCTTKDLYSWRCLCKETVDIVEAQIKLLSKNKYGKMVSEKHFKLDFIPSSGGLIKGTDHNSEVFKPIDKDGK
jgi:hypothetical protein